MLHATGILWLHIGKELRKNEENQFEQQKNAFACFKEQTAGAHKLANHIPNAQVAVNN